MSLPEPCSHGVSGRQDLVELGVEVVVEVKFIDIRLSLEEDLRADERKESGLFPEKLLIHKASPLAACATIDLDQFHISKPSRQYHENLRAKRYLIRYSQDVPGVSGVFEVQALYLNFPAGLYICFGDANGAMARM
jgi:hypothetical protein